MKRIFVTTNLRSLLRLLKNTELEAGITEVETKFISWPQVYSFNNGFELIFLEDKFSDWDAHNIDKESDGILYHKNSNPNVIAIIKQTFKHVTVGSHLIDEPHERLCQALFNGKQNDGEKAIQIISDLFKPVLGDDDSRTTVQEAQKAFRQFYKSCVLGLIKSRNETNTTEELRNLQGELLIIEKYVKGKLDVQVSFDKLHSETSIESFYQFLNENHQKLEAEIFG